MTTIEQRPLKVFVLIDALGWKFVEKSEFLAGLLPYRMPLRTVLGFSSGAIPTILTGLPPSGHLHWNLFYYDPDGSPFRWLRPAAALPKRLMDHRVTRKIAKELGRRVLGLGKNFECCVSPRYLPWFNWVERSNIYDREGITGARSIFDDLAAGGVQYRVYSYHQWSDRDILCRASREIQETTAAFFFVYLSELDMVLHTACENSDAFQARLCEYERALYTLFRTCLRRDPGAVLAVFSDHGMTPVRASLDLIGQIECLGFSMPDDYLAVYDSTMARYWFRNDQARLAITRCLTEQTCGRILSDSELNSLGVWFEDRRYGEVIFLLEPGWILERSDFNGPRWNPLGMHGYHPDDEWSDAAFLTNVHPPFALTTIKDVHRFMTYPFPDRAAHPIGTGSEEQGFTVPGRNRVPRSVHEV